MNLALSWLAVESIDKDALLRRLGLRETGWVSNELRADLACAILPNGWTVIVSTRYGRNLDKLLAEASMGGMAFICEAWDVVMYSAVRAHRDGRSAWAVTHDPDKDRDGVTVQGEPPPQFADIRAKLAAEAAAEPDEPVDWWFDAPVELAKSICGYGPGSAPSVEWSTLAEAADARPARPRARTLRDSIGDELMPLLQSLGWDLAAGRAEWPNAFYSGTRIRDGRLQFVYLVGKDDGKEVYLFPSFAAWPGPRHDQAPLIAGEVRPARGSVWTRLAGRWRELSGSLGPDERLDRIVAKVRADIIAIDALLVRGEVNADLSFELGSAAAWLAALRAAAPDLSG
jgi:hypothetical protein